jgi:hypothetical protein
MNFLTDAVTTIRLTATITTSLISYKKLNNNENEE